MQEIKVLVIGKTGVGKSSFLNYLLDEDLATTGKGKPITQDFDEYTKTIDGKLRLTITDSKGLEALEFEKIKQDIQNYINAKNSGDNIADYFHVVFYCLNYTKGRIEELEGKLIKDLRELLGYDVQFILTHSDSIEKDRSKYQTYVKRIKDLVEFDIKLYKVCSINKNKLGGGKIVKSGKDEIIKDLVLSKIENLLTYFTNKLAQEYALKYNDILDKHKTSLETRVDENIGFLNRLSSPRESALNGIKEEFRKSLSEIKQEIEQMQDDLIDKFMPRLDEILVFCSLLGKAFNSNFAIKSALNSKKLKNSLYIKDYSLWDRICNVFTNDDAKESFQRYFDEMKFNLSDEMLNSNEKVERYIKNYFAFVKNIFKNLRNKRKMSNDERNLANKLKDSIMSKINSSF